MTGQGGDGDALTFEDTPLNNTFDLVPTGPGAGNLTILGPGVSTGAPVLTVNTAAAASLSGVTLDGNSYQNSGIAVGSAGSENAEKQVTNQLASISSSSSSMPSRSPFVAAIPEFRANDFPCCFSKR